MLLYLHLPGGKCCCIFMQGTFIMALNAAGSDVLPKNKRLGTAMPSALAHLDGHRDNHTELLL